MKKYIQTKAIAKNSFSNGDVPYTKITFDTELSDCSVDEEIFTSASHTTLYMSQELHDNIQQRGALNESGTHWDDAPIVIATDPYQYLEVTVVEGMTPTTYSTEEGLYLQVVENNDDSKQMKITGVRENSEYLTIPPYVRYGSDLYLVSVVTANALTSSTLKAVLFVELDNPMNISLEKPYIVPGTQTINVFCTYNETKEKLISMTTSNNVKTYSIEDLEQRVTNLENNLVLMNEDVTFASLEITNGNLYLDNPDASIKIKKSS